MSKSGFTIRINGTFLEAAEGYRYTQQANNPMFNNDLSDQKGIYTFGYSLARTALNSSVLGFVDELNSATAPDARFEGELFYNLSFQGKVVITNFKISDKQINCDVEASVSPFTDVLNTKINGNGLAVLNDYELTTQLLSEEAQVPITISTSYTHFYLNWGLIKYASKDDPRVFTSIEVEFLDKITGDSIKKFSCNVTNYKAPLKNLKKLPYPAYNYGWNSGLQSLCNQINEDTEITAKAELVLAKNPMKSDILDFVINTNLLTEQKSNTLFKLTSIAKNNSDFKDLVIKVKDNIFYDYQITYNGYKIETINIEITTVEDIFLGIIENRNTITYTSYNLGDPFTEKITGESTYFDSAETNYLKYERLDLKTIFSEDEIVKTYPRVNYQFPTIKTRDFYRGKAKSKDGTDFFKEIANIFANENGNMYPEKPDAFSDITVIPCPFLAYVVDKIFDKIGFPYELTNTSKFDYYKLILCNNNAIDNFLKVPQEPDPSYINMFYTKIQLGDVLPEISIKEFLQSLSVSLGWVYFYDAINEKIQIEYLDDLMNTTKISDITEIAEPYTEFYKDKYNGFSIEINNQYQELAATEASYKWDNGEKKLSSVFAASNAAYFYDFNINVRTTYAAIAINSPANSKAFELSEQVQLYLAYYFGGQTNIVDSEHFLKWANASSGRLNGFDIEYSEQKNFTLFPGSYNGGTWKLHDKFVQLLKNTKAVKFRVNWPQEEIFHPDFWKRKYKIRENYYFLKQYNEVELEGGSVYFDCIFYLAIDGFSLQT